jgi:zinc/manganese transport system substrate-binding protein
VAAENVWGSVAQQLGGSRVHVTSIISNPNTDPHDYEPTVADARAIADCRLVILNGVGYDPWVARLVAADPGASREVLDVGALVGVPAGGNPHLWYSPADVREVATRVAADYTRLDPAGATYYAARRASFEASALAGYDVLVAEIRSKYAGTPIGASESLVTPLADGLGLKVLTPATFLTAISEGTGPSAADKATVDAQIRSKAVKVFIYNSQNATPDVTALVAEARANGIPVVTLTETMVPSTGTFQGWQAAQLEALLAALRQATGR